MSALYLNVAELKYFDTAAFRPLVGRWRDFLYRDELTQAARRLV